MEQRKLFQGYSPPNIGSYAPLKISVIFFVSGLFLLQFTLDQAETWFTVTPWSGAGHIILRLQSSIY